jgi:hypothetical protein
MLAFVAAAFEGLFSKFAVTHDQNQAAGALFTPLNNHCQSQIKRSDTLLRL